jgi:hypothetical protein
MNVVLSPGMRILQCVALSVGLAWSAQAQQTTPSSTIAPSGHEKKSVRKRVKVSKPADFSGAGLLQFEYGYDGDFHSPDTDRDQAGTASLLFNATDDLQLETDFDTFHSQKDKLGAGAAGIGDAYFSAQVSAIPESERHPSLALTYLIKLPTASADKGLGSGRVDHKFTIMSSRKVHGIDFDFNASLLINGNPDTDRWDNGYQLALGFSNEISDRLCVQGELFGETLDTDQPQGLFLQGGFTYEATPRASFDPSVRAGLDSVAPRFGLSAGVSISVANLH